MNEKPAAKRLIEMGFTAMNEAAKSQDRKSHSAIYIRDLGTVEVAVSWPKASWKCNENETTVSEILAQIRRIK